ncbi:MAG: GNAT family N-acetyltransferase [Fimbriimonadia bacterium]|jgi:RimJ/RimL family protein N-acetyltransferase
MLDELADGEIRIRRHREGDVDALFEAARESIAEVGRWLPWCHPDYRREETAEWIAGRIEAWDRGDAYEFVIEDAETGRVLGGVGINSINRGLRSANLGYWVRTTAAGRGVATAAARLAARFALEVMGLVRVYILADVENLPSQRVAEKAGAVREGVLRNALVLRGEPRDAVGYSLIPGDL